MTLFDLKYFSKKFFIKNNINTNQKINLLQSNGMILNFMTSKDKSNKKIVKTAVSQNGLALRYASSDLINDKKLVLIAVKNYGFAFKYASKDLKKDTQVLKEAINTSGNVLSYADKKLKLNKLFVKKAVKKNGFALQYADEILKELQTEFEIEPIDLSSSAEVAKRYRYKDHTSEFGLVTSVTQPFCGGCTRARISADGKLYTCLFANTGLDLKKILRAEKYNKDQLLSILSKHWGQRDDRYSELRAVTKSAQEKVEMSYIGG